MRVAIPWINTPSPRLDRQQNFLARKLLADGHKLFLIPGEPRPLMSDALVAVRKACGNEQYFAYSNSDVVPFVSLADVAKPGGVVGLSRVESDGKCYHGVDLFIFDVSVWDRLYAHDLPAMYAGSHATDWWIARTAHAAGCYYEAAGLRHETHKRSEASAGLDKYGKPSAAEWTAYANRRGLEVGELTNRRRNSVE